MESGDWQSGTFGLDLVVGAFIGLVSHARGALNVSWPGCRVASAQLTHSYKVAIVKACKENLSLEPINPSAGLTTHFLRIGGIGAGAFLRPKDRTVILLSPSSFGFFTSTLLNLVFSRALPRVALTAL